MAMVRAVGSFLLVAGMFVGSVRPTSTEAVAPSALPCTSGALGGAFTGAPSLRSLDNFGCQGNWAFTWATVGTGLQQIGVTDVLHFEATSGRWVLVARAQYCKPQLLPSVVYRLGCFSN